LGGLERLSGRNRLNRPPNFHPVVFAGSNYLRDEALFNKLKTLADSDRMAVAHVDLGDVSAVERLANSLAQLKILWRFWT